MRGINFLKTHHGVSGIWENEWHWNKNGNRQIKKKNPQYLKKH